MPKKKDVAVVRVVTGIADAVDAVAGLVIGIGYLIRHQGWKISCWLVRRYPDPEEWDYQRRLDDHCEDLYWGATPCNLAAKEE